MVSLEQNQSWLENATGKKSMGLRAESTKEEGTLSTPVFRTMAWIQTQEPQRRNLQPERQGWETRSS